ncbi:MAG: terminase small subunit [Oscillospiraceae bacterium]|jgi:hypothetical protein|nr:terminase small subunit [Oscillospiraceae bacterium]
MKKRLNEQEKQFCISFVRSGNIEDSAMAAGYAKNPRQSGDELMCKAEVIAEIERLSALQRKSLSLMAAVGYQRLAFGGVADAVSLLFMDNPSPRKLAKMDLFSVAEIRKPKEGSMEIKFFDRLKALEKLETALPPEDKAKSLFEALSAGAVSLNIQQGLNEEADIGFKAGNIDD